jgi:hypothetical protein
MALGVGSRRFVVAMKRGTLMGVVCQRILGVGIVPLAFMRGGRLLWMRLVGCILTPQAFLSVNRDMLLLVISRRAWLLFAERMAVITTLAGMVNVSI